MECAPTDMWAKMSMRVRVMPHRLFGSLRDCTQCSLGEEGLDWPFMVLMWKIVLGDGDMQMTVCLTLVHSRCYSKITFVFPTPVSFFPPFLLLSFLPFLLISFLYFSFLFSLPCPRPLPTSFPFTFLYMPLQCRELMLMKHTQFVSSRQSIAHFINL